MNTNSLSSAPNPSLIQPPAANPALASFGYAAAPTSATSAAAQPFSSALNGAQIPTAKAETLEERRQRAEDAAAGLVANALILPVLKQLRHSPWRQNTVFSPGTGEKTFGPEFDIQLADRLARSPGMAATHVLAKRLMGPEVPLQKPAATTQTGLDVHG